MSSEPMSARKRAQAAFAAAVVLLCLSALATYVTIVRLLESEEWVAHTREVQAALGNVDSAVLTAGRASSGYVITGSPDFLDNFQVAMPKVREALEIVRTLTKDNPTQQQLSKRLAEVTEQRVALLQESVALKKSDPGNQSGQAEISRRSLPI